MLILGRSADTCVNNDAMFIDVNVFNKYNNYTMENW